MKIVVFTAIMVNNPDKDHPIDNPGYFKTIPNWDYILFTNINNGHEVFKNSGWGRYGKICIMDPPFNEMPEKTRQGWSIYAARWFKWHPDTLFSDYDFAIWIDAWQVPDVKALNTWNDIINKMHLISDNNPCENKYHIAFSPHPKNNCTYKEHKSIIDCRKDTYINMLRTTKYIKTMRFPENQGLVWTGCYIYKIGSTVLLTVFNNLWNDMLLYTYRDQALIMFELWRNNNPLFLKIQTFATILISVDSDQNHIYT